MAIEHFQFGDIILTRNSSLMGQVNAAYQKYRRGRYLTDTIKSYAFIPTHAALLLTDTEVIHSNKRSSRPKSPKKVESLIRRIIQILQFFKHLCRNGLGQALRQVEYQEMLNLTRLLLGHGVDIDTKFLENLEASDTLVIRHPMLTNLDLSAMATIRRSAYYHLDKPYNPFIEASDGQGITAFCSQLIYMIFKKVGLEMPSQLAHQVLPLDFLIWAVTDNWQIITHEQVGHLLSQHKQYRGVCPAFNYRGAEIQETVVERIQIRQRDIQLAGQVEQLLADQIQTLKGPVPRPTLYRALGMKSEPISVERIIQAGDNFYRYLTGCELPNVNTPSAAEDKASVFSALETLKEEELSWLLDKTSEDKKTAPIDPQLFSSKLTIKTAEALLDDFDLALKKAIAHINTQPDTSESTPLQQSGKTSDINESLELLWFVAGFFERDMDKEDIEKRLSDVDETLTVLGKQIADGSQGLIKVFEAYGQDSEQFVQSSKTCMAGVVRYHAYACAYDFLMICRVLARLDDLLAGRNLTLSNLYELNPQALLEFLTTMDPPRRMWPVTRACINDLSPFMKQYWDNI